MHSNLASLYRSSSLDSVHLAESEWEELACGEMEPEARAAAFDHITRCAECTRIFEVLSLVEEEAAGFDPGAPSSLAPPPDRRGLRRGIGAGLALAASLLLAIIFWHPASREQHGDSVLRAASEAGRPVPLEPLGVRSEAPTRFSWQPAPGERLYRLELLDENGELLWKSEELTGGSAPWPPDLPAEPGLYYWRILVLGELSTPPSSSELVHFELRMSP